MPLQMGAGKVSGMFLSLGAKSQELPTNFLASGGSIQPIKANRPMGACINHNEGGQVYLKLVQAPFIWVRELCRAVHPKSMQVGLGWRNWTSSGWKGPQKITRPTLHGNREPGWDGTPVSLW